MLGTVQLQCSGLGPGEAGKSSSVQSLRRVSLSELTLHCNVSDREGARPQFVYPEHLLLPTPVLAALRSMLLGCVPGSRMGLLEHRPGKAVQNVPKTFRRDRTKPGHGGRERTLMSDVTGEDEPHRAARSSLHTLAWGPSLRQEN